MATAWTALVVGSILLAAVAGLPRRPSALAPSIVYRRGGAAFTQEALLPGVAMSAMSSGAERLPRQRARHPRGLGLAIAAAVTLFGPLDAALDRAPFGLLGGASLRVRRRDRVAIGRWRAR